MAGHQLLAWEAGTGKTMTALWAVEELFHTIAKHGRVLIICPANVRLQWYFAALSVAFETQIIVDTKTPVRSDAEIVIASFHASLSPVFWKSAMRLQWDALTIDEAHNTNNPQAKWTKGIFGSRKGSQACLVAQVDRVWLLTGTPIMNDPSELWVAVSRLFPTVLDQCGVTKRKEWIARWCVTEDTPYGPRVIRAKDQAELRKLLLPHMLRVRRRDVLHDLPPLITDVHVLPPREIKIDSAVVDSAVAEFFKALGVDDDAADGDFSAIDALEPQLATLRRAVGLSKAKEVAEYVRAEIAGTDRKALVFFLHTDVGHEIARELSDLGAVIFDGKIGQTQREKNKARFITDPACQVFVGQIEASGTGTDGLQIADRVIIAEEPWSPAKLDDQVIPRAHRAGQKNKVHATSVRVQGSIDEHVGRLLARKRKMISPIVNGEA